MHVLKNFKNFADAELDLLRPMTLMIGRNGSGKSNVIEGVELLAQIAHGRPLYEISDVGRGSGTTFELRGGLPGCLRQDQDELGMPGVPFGQFSLGFEASLSNKEFSYNITISLTPQAKIFEEILTWDGSEVFSATLGGSGDILDVRYNNFKRGGRKPITHLPADRSVLSRYEQFVDGSGKSEKQRQALNLVRITERHLNAAFAFDPNPKKMREYENIGQSTLLKDGSNLSSVLYELSRGNEKQRATLDSILEKLKELPEESFSSIEFEVTRLNEVIIAFKYPEESLISAKLLSDGTLRALAILTALETVPERSRIIIEEMDNGIHPSRVQMLVDVIWECSKRRKLNVLATTHNPATLNCLSAEQVKSVVLCYHDHELKTSRLTPITEMPMSDILLERGRLGDLVTRRVVEQHLMPSFEEERKQKAMAWLESLV